MTDLALLLGGAATPQPIKASLCLLLKGGPGSGNFGHEGRPGLVGGSGEGGDLSTKHVDAQGYERGPSLNPSEVAIEQKFYDNITADKAGMMEAYKAISAAENKGNPHVVDPDLVKKLSSDFMQDKGLAAAVHEPSSYLSKQIFTKELADNKAAGNPLPIIFTAGGSGSGKTESGVLARSVLGLSENNITFDSTLSKFSSATAKIDQAIAAGNHVSIVYTDRPVGLAYSFAAKRDRVVPLTEVADAHVGASNTIRELYNHYEGNPNVTISIISNQGSKADMHVATIASVPHYEKDQVVASLRTITENMRSNGDIDDAKYKALTRQSSHAKRDNRAGQGFEKQESMDARHSGRTRGEGGRGSPGVSLAQLIKGGPGSGNFDHEGRPGEIGGSGGSHTAETIGFDKSPWEFARYKNAPDNRPDILSVKDAHAIREQLRAQGRLNPDNTVSLYHVTLPDEGDLDSIQARGLVPGANPAPGQDWKAEHSSYATYFHSSRDAAEGNVEQAGKDEARNSPTFGRDLAVIIEARIPVTPKSLIRLLPDEDVDLDRKAGVRTLLEQGAVAYIGGVPSSHIITHHAKLAKQTVDHRAYRAAPYQFNLKRPPTDKEKKAGNYPKGHIKVSGLDISIENPAYSKRRPEWGELKAHYGYIKRTQGADGDQVDVFVKVGTEDTWAGNVYVINQSKAGDSNGQSHAFDEHKVMIGWPDYESAKQGYHDNYHDGWDGFHSMATLTMPEFKAWLKMGDTLAPHPAAKVDSTSRFIQALEDLLDVVKGGAGSGNFGHSGRPGEIGGSGGGDTATPPSSEDQQKGAENIKQFVEFLGTMQKTPEGFANTPASLMLAHGRPFETDKHTYEGARGTQHQCFKNAGKDALANDNHTYVEGYVSVHGVPLHHAWTVNNDTGKIIDRTINIRDGTHPSGYFGIPISTKALQESMHRTKVWGVLGIEYNEKLYKEPLPAHFVADIPEAKVKKGGAGSGNFGHAGRPGEVGGSGDAQGMLDEIDKTWHANPMGRGYAFQYTKEGPVVLVELAKSPSYNMATNTFEEGKSEVHVSSILVGPSGRRQGVGTKTMNRLSELADKHGVTMNLTPKAFGTGTKMSDAQLKKWYTKLGYEAPKYDKTGFVIGHHTYRRKPNVPG